MSVAPEPPEPQLAIPCPTCGCFEHPDDSGMPAEALAVLQDPDNRWNVEAPAIETLIARLREQPQGVWRMGRRGLLSLVLGAKAVGAAEERAKRSADLNTVGVKALNEYGGHVRGCSQGCDTKARLPGCSEGQRLWDAAWDSARAAVAARRAEKAPVVPAGAPDGPRRDPAAIRRRSEEYHRHQQCDPAPGGCMVEGNDDEIG